MMRVKHLVWLLLPLLATPLAAQSLEERVERLERVIEAQRQVDLHGRMEQLQREVRELRGQLESMGHEVGQMSRRQRDLYSDSDRRLTQVERKLSGAQPTAPAAPTTPQPPAAPSDTAVDAGEISRPVEASTPAASRVIDPEGEVTAYQRAFDLLRELRYDQAIGQFEAFLEGYPEGRYAHIAQYWIGEAHYAQRRYPEAIEAYDKLRARHANSPKLAEALLKIGYSYHELEQWERARNVLTELQKSYPGTTEAGQADSLLQRMRREGR